MKPIQNADISMPRISVTGEQLPTARYISSTIHRDLGYHDHAVTVFLPAFGQLIDHDMAAGAETKGMRFSLSLLRQTSVSMRQGRREGGKEKKKQNKSPSQ